MAQTAKLKHVLVADDDPVFTSLVAACLEPGFDTTVVGNGAEALQLLAYRPFDLAIVDLDMPCIDGFRLLGLVRGQQSLNKLALLVITSSRSPSDHAEALRLGADAFLTKPVAWGSFPDLARRLIQIKELPQLGAAHAVETELARLSKRHLSLAVH